MRLLVVTSTPDGFDRRAKNVASHLEMVHARPGGEEYEDALRSSAILLGLPPVDDVARATSLEWLQLSSAGADRYAGAVPHGIALTTASGVYGVPVAEHSFAMILAHARGLPKNLRDQSQRRWDRDGIYRELNGSTCGLLGAGDIGVAVARRAKAFGMRVLAMRRNVADRPEPVDEVYPTDRLDEMLARCDFVVNTLPATDATHRVLNAARLRSMKRGSFLCNVGRGSTVDEAALVEVLRDGHLAGAGLDVFEDEPLSAESPLWEMETVIITPHVGGLSPRENERVADVFIRNLERFVRGDELINRVDPKIGY